MKMNKKGFFPGWEYVASFFVLSIVFIFGVGFYDFQIVEIYEPIHAELNESLHLLNATSGLAYEEFVNNSTEVHSKNLPFNLLYMFVFFYSVIISVISVGKQKKLEPMELIFKTIGGMIFFLYLMQIAIFKVVTYFKVQIIDYLFQDLIASYIPFYLTLYDNAGLVILIWGIVLILVNWYFGEKEQDFTGVFGQ